MNSLSINVMFRITDPTPSPSPPKTFHRRIVDHQHYQSYAPFFRPDNSHLGPSPPAPYHKRNHHYLSFGTSLVNGLCPTHASLFGISDYGYARSRYHMIQFTSPHVYSFHHAKSLSVTGNVLDFVLSCPELFSTYFPFRKDLGKA